MKVVLELQDQPSNIKKVTVRHDIVIGRGAECNLRLSAPQVSRRHSFLRISADSATITDLDSSNGTFLNGKKLTSGKRYDIPDGARLAIGPVQFTARVQSEVPVADLLEVSVNDERIETEADRLPGGPFDDFAAEPSMDATVADLLPEPDEDSMNFAIESGGPVAEEDEATADYVATDGLSDGNYFDDTPGGILDTLPVDDEATIAAGEMDLPIVAEVTPAAEDVKSGEIEVVDEIMDADAIEIVDVMNDVPIIDDDEVMLSDEDVMVVEDETIMANGASGSDDVIEVDAEDLLILDDEDEPVADSVDHANESADSDETADSGDSDEDDLRNFLQGLD